MPAHFGARPGFRMAVVPGAGHLPNLQCPEAFNRILSAFLEGHAFQTTKETA